MKTKNKLTHLAYTRLVSKKAITLTHIINWAIAILVIIALFTFGYRAYMNYKENSWKAKATDSINDMFDAIKELKNVGDYKEAMLLYPKDSFIVAYEKGIIIPKTCDVNKNCLCICNRVDCIAQGTWVVCKPIDEKIEILDYAHVYTGFWGGWETTKGATEIKKTPFVLVVTKENRIRGGDFTGVHFLYREDIRNQEIKIFIMDYNIYPPTEDDDGNLVEHGGIGRSVIETIKSNERNGMYR
jgi:hypothetical protein